MAVSPDPSDFSSTPITVLLFYPSSGIIRLERHERRSGSIKKKKNGVHLSSRRCIFRETLSTHLRVLGVGVKIKRERENNNSDKGGLLFHVQVFVNGALVKIRMISNDDNNTDAASRTYKNNYIDNCNYWNAKFNSTDNNNYD